MTDKRWDAIIATDYSLVLPLPLKRTLGPFRQVHRAPFTQQGGPYGQYSPGSLMTMLSRLPGTVLSCNIPLSERYIEASLPRAFSKLSRTNLTLDLSPDYPDILSGCSKTLRKKLRRYPSDDLQPSSPEEVLRVYKASSGQKAKLSTAHFRQIHMLMKTSSEYGLGKLYRIEEDGILLAAGFFPVFRGRVINLFAGSTQAGFKRDGMARLLAGVIRAHRGPGHLLDFEGSEIPGVASFFKAFGAQISHYPLVSRKRLFQ